MKSQKIRVPLGPLVLILGCGDDNGNGIVDVSADVEFPAAPWINIPALVVDASAENAKRIVDGFKSFADALTKKK